MKNLLSPETTQEVLDALNEAISEGPWEQSNFLRAIGKNLNDMRDEISANVSGGSPAQKAVMDSNIASQIALRKEQLEVFVALYTSDGKTLSSWERLIANLPRQIVSRPIYMDEDALKSFIRSKENIQNEAYVSVYINQQDVLSLGPDRTPKDKLGKSLLTLKDNAVVLDNVNRFVHVSGIYQYRQGRLVKVVNG